MDEKRVRPIGHVRSPLKSLDQAPPQGDEGAPDAWIELREDVLPGIDGIAPGQELIVLTFFHKADGTPVVDIKPQIHGVPDG